MCGICLQNWIVNAGTSVESFAVQINRPVESVIRWIACRNRPRPAARDAIFRLTGVTFPTRSSASSCRCHRHPICPGVVPIPGSLGQLNRTQTGNVQAPVEPVASEARQAAEEAPTDEERDDDEHQPESAQPSSGDRSGYCPENGTTAGVASTGNGNGSNGSHAAPSFLVALDGEELARRSEEAFHLACYLDELSRAARTETT